MYMQDDRKLIQHVLQKGYTLSAFGFCDLDELLMVKSGDLVLTPVGHHPISAPLGSNVYHMAGEARNEQRSIAPGDDTDWAWMCQDWDNKTLRIPCGQ